jgi:hypothetical protein
MQRIGNARRSRLGHRREDLGAAAFRGESEDIAATDRMDHGRPAEFSELIDAPSCRAPVVLQSPPLDGTRRGQALNLEKR